MKPRLYSMFFKTARLIASFAWCLASPSVAQAADRDPLFPGTVRPGRLNYRIELQQGYLKVYSAIEEFKDGDAWYFPHSSYKIYTIDGKLLKNVGNHISRSDEIPEIVALPVGFYTVVARAEKAGYIRLPVVINEGQQTILDLDVWETKTLRQFAHTTEAKESSAGQGSIL